MIRINSTPPLTWTSEDGWQSADPDFVDDGIKETARVRIGRYDPYPEATAAKVLGRLYGAVVEIDPREYPELGPDEVE